MADITFTCSGCNRTIRAPAERAGQTCRCPSCKQQLTVPDAASDQKTSKGKGGTPDPEPSNPRFKKCPYCAEDIFAVAIKCKYCGSMLDGSDKAQKVNVVEKDPFAEYHTEIKGKKEGKLTGIGIAGVVLGIIIMLVSIAGCFATDDTEAGQEIFMVFMVGVGFTVASYLWARRKK